MITISVSGLSIMVILVLLGGYIGWRESFRGVLTVTLVSSIAYLLLVSGLEQVLGYLENFYVNLPKLFAILIGGDPDVTPQWDPLGFTIGIPLPARIVLFIAVVIASVVLNNKPKWYNKTKDLYSKQLGAFSGGLTVLLWMSALTTFQRELTLSGSTLPDVVNTAVGAIPDVTGIAPWFILVFLLFVGIMIVLNLPKVWAK